jgi:hypothetical protein
MHELITLSYQMKCGITVHPLEYEKNMSQVKIGDPKTYFTRHQKLNK